MICCHSFDFLPIPLPDDYTRKDFPICFIYDSPLKIVIKLNYAMRFERNSRKIYQSYCQPGAILAFYSVAEQLFLPGIRRNIFLLRIKSAVSRNFCFDLKKLNEMLNLIQWQIPKPEGFFRNVMNIVFVVGIQL